MKLVRFHNARTGGIDAGFVTGDEIVCLDNLLLSDSVLSASIPELAMRAARDPSLWERLAAVKRRIPLGQARLAPPVDPVSFRDFYAFEEHVRNARKNRGLEMVPEWYDQPVFYFSNVSMMRGPDEPVHPPPETEELDFELEIGAVIGREGVDISVEEADSFIAGFTIINDWSARDIQRKEMKVGLGPAKGKDFATSIGPFLVTPDELEGCVTDRSRGKRYSLQMTARVNGVVYSRGNAADMRWTFAELISRASQSARLLPGDLIGSGTVGTGCITEFPPGTFPWLRSGDVVELEIQGLGILRSPVA